MYEPNAVFWVVQSFQNRKNVDWWRSPKWTTFHVKDDVHIDAVRDLILQNRRLTIREIAEDVGISFGSCQAILTEKLNMHRVAAKFVPRVLTEDQKANRVNISQELLDRVSVDENFLKTIVTGDETWVYGYDVETKAQSSQWVGQGSPRPKKVRMSRLYISDVFYLLTVGVEDYCYT